MRRRSACLAAIAAFLWPVPACAAEWIRFFTTNDGTSTYYDPASLARSGNSVRVAVSAVMAADADGDVREYRAVEEMHCGQNTRSTVALVAEMRGGGEQRLDPGSETRSIEPNTTASALCEIVCDDGGTTI